MKKQSFVIGAVVLAACAILCKILGAIYRIPLTNILGVNGMGIYYLIFPIYSFMLTVSSSSFPTAISHLVSISIARGDNKKASAMLRVSLVVLTLIGLVSTLIIFALAKPFATLQGQSRAYFGYFAIAPSIFLVSILAAYRGYFQGLQNMVPSGISQIIEQLTKLVFGLLLSIKLIKYGVVYGVIGALLAVSISECFAVGYLVVYYAVFKKKNPAFKLNKIDSKYKIVELIKEIFKEVLPYMLGTIVFPLSTLIDSFLVVNLLQGAGFSSEVATNLFGINSAVVGSMTNLPTVVSTSVAIAIIPSLSYSIKNKDSQSIKQKASFSIKICLLITLPCAVVFILFANNIVDILFASGLQGGSFDQFALAYKLLSVAGVGVVYLCLMQVLTAILQSLSKPYIPVISLSIAVVVKVIVECILLLQPSINIYGAVISNIVCYLIASVINLYFVKKHINIKFSFVHMFILTICALLVMSAVIYAMLLLLSDILGKVIATLVAFVIGAISYFVCLFWFKIFDKSELQFLRKIKISKK